MTVNSGGGADATTINGALDMIRAAPEVDNEVLITGGGPYEEVIIIDVPVAIRGADSENRPTIIIVQNDTVAGRELDGIVNSAGVDITLENLIFIPSLSAWPTDDGFDFMPLTDADDFSITVKNCLVTANDGTDKPVTLDGLTYEENKMLSGAVSIQDDGFQILSVFGGRPNGKIHATLDGLVVSHIAFDGVPDSSSGQDCFILGGDNLTVTMKNTVASYGERFGFQLLQNVTVNMEGTPDAPIIAKGMGSSGVLCFSGFHDWNYVQCLENPLGVRIDLDTNQAHSINHLLVTGASDLGLGYFYAPAEGLVRDFSVKNATFYNCAEALALRLGAGVAGDALQLSVSDIVVAGEGGDDTFFVPAVGVDETPAASVTISNSAVVTDGPNAVLPGDFLDVLTMTDIINADPMFVSTDPTSSDFLKVSSDAYASAGTDGSMLAGYYGMDDSPTSSVNLWALYLK
ncbi:MAG: hypothetical protein GC154_10545 [bacterium]|nr:hypothetical protein [bacterium]